MCLIIAPGPDGQKPLLPREVFDYAYGRNDDGFGAMWTEDGKVNHIKTLGLTGDEIYRYMEEYCERYENVVFHMRYRTHGKVTPGLCHPFRILHRSRHGKDLFFMHNGVLGEWGRDLKPGQSDTTNFKDKILVPILTRDPSALEDPEIMSMLNKLTSGSRLIFLDSDGKMTRTSPSSWNNRYGLTLSNTYMLPAEAYKPTYTIGTPPPVDNRDTTFAPGATSKSTSLIYNAYRNVIRNGVISGHWCSIPKTGFVRTEAGNLYIDQGANTAIEHEKWIINRENEAVALASFSRTKEEIAADSARRLLSVVDSDDTPFVDDDVPFDYPDIDDDEDDVQYVANTNDRTTTVGEAVASHDERLRYARFVHNCHGGVVADRTQLVSDLMCSGREELEAMVKADPETSHTILAELFEIFICQNDMLARDAQTEEYAFDPDEMLEHGEMGYHRQGMADITKARRAYYEQMLKDKVEEAAVKNRMEEAHKKAYPEDAASQEAA